MPRWTCIWDLLRIDFEAEAQVSVKEQDDVILGHLALQCTNWERIKELLKCESCCQVLLFVGSPRDRGSANGALKDIHGRCNLCSRKQATYSVQNVMVLFLEDLSNQWAPCMRGSKRPPVPSIVAQEADAELSWGV